MRPMTEEEAKTLCCPYQLNSPPDVQSVNCLGTECMAFVKVGSKPKSLHDTSEPERTYVCELIHRGSK